jgi:hypothetical protein
MLGRSITQEKIYQSMKGLGAAQREVRAGDQYEWSCDEGGEGVAGQIYDEVGDGRLTKGVQESVKFHRWGTRKRNDKIIDKIRISEV